MIRAILAAFCIAAAPVAYAADAQKIAAAIP